jgi:cytochrome d ubiquinol oxidase subunit I
VVAVGLAFVANEVGWVAAEVGRQPWIVYPTVGLDGALTGGLRTSAGVSEVVTAHEVLGSIIMFGFIYVLLFVLWVYLLNRAIQRGPDVGVTSPLSPAGDGLNAVVAAQAQLRGALQADREERT